MKDFIGNIIGALCVFGVPLALLFIVHGFGH